MNAICGLAQNQAIIGGPMAVAAPACGGGIALSDQNMAVGKNSTERTSASQIAKINVSINSARIENLPLRQQRRNQTRMATQSESSSAIKSGKTLNPNMPLSYPPAESPSRIVKRNMGYPRFQNLATLLLTASKPKAIALPVANANEPQMTMNRTSQ